MHSPEPWSHLAHNSLKAEVVYDKDGRCVVDVAWYDNHEDNAARIVACINACAGITTERLASMDLREAIEILDSHQGNIDCNDYCGVAKSLSRSKE